MDDKDYKEESLFRRIEAWTLEWDLHIWYGILSIIAVAILLLIIDKEADKAADLGKTIIILQSQLQSCQGKVLGLQADMEAQRQAYLMPRDTLKKPSESVEKAATKVSEKIDKVQDALINKVQQPKIITKTETTTITTPVVKELNSIMFESYCSTVPDSFQCKKVTKK